MIAKIHSGQGFAGLVDYANDIKNKKAGTYTGIRPYFRQGKEEG